MPRSVLEAEHARLVNPTRPVDTALEAVGLSDLSTRPTPPTVRGLSLSEDIPPREPLPHMGTHPDTSRFRVHNEIPGNKVLYDSDLPSAPSPEVREALMGFRVGETDVPGLSIAQRVRLLYRCTYLNSISWAITTIRAHDPSLDSDQQGPSDNAQRGMRFTSSQTLPSIENMPNLPYGGAPSFTRPPQLFHTSGPPNISPKTRYTQMALISKATPI